MSFSTTRRWPRPCVRTWQRELCCFATAPFPAKTSWPRSQGSWRKRRSDSELFDQSFGICGASLSATSRAAGGALHLLYTHPEQLDQLIRNPALIPDALEECFRLASWSVRRVGFAPTGKRRLVTAHRRRWGNRPAACG